MGSLELLSYFWSLNTIPVAKIANFDFGGLSPLPNIAELVSYYQKCSQVNRICSPNQTACSIQMRKDSFGCRVECSGLYVDVSYSKGNPRDTTMDDEDRILDTEGFLKLAKDYKDFKSMFVRNLVFNSTSPGLGEHFRYFLNANTLHFCPCSSLIARHRDLLH